jgi:hypothetical protein
MGIRNVLNTPRSLMLSGSYVLLFSFIGENLRRTRRRCRVIGMTLLSTSFGFSYRFWRSMSGQGGEVSV